MPLRGWIGTSFIVFHLLVPALRPGTLSAQLAAAGAGEAQAPGSSARTYDGLFDELIHMRPRASAEVSSLVLQRDVGRLTLGRGHLYLLSPVGGRIVGAVFKGDGVFSFVPAGRIERDRLRRLERTDSLEAPFSELLLIFADGTLEQLEAALEFRADGEIEAMRGSIDPGLEFLADEDSRTVDPDFMSAWLNRERSELFFAYVRRKGGDPITFSINPNEFEGVRLQRRIRRVGYDRHGEVITQFPLQGRTRDGRVQGERLRQVAVEHYALDVSLPPSGIGEIGFAATATMRIVADTAVGPWVAFELFEKLVVDSASWEDGEHAPFARGKESPLLWVKLDRQIRPGDRRTLKVHYHGDLIDRYVDFFRIKSSAAWYPRSLEGRSLATFDLSFSTGFKYLLASVGDKVDSSRADRTIRSRWVTRGPIRNASFNLGLFEGYEVREADAPPVTVMISEEAHKKLAREYAQQSRMRERVGADVAKSLKFFQQVYGPAPVARFYATEIPDYHGEAFPGMVHLSWVTFQNTSDEGWDEVFRAHEVAHQWWGIGVDFASYHDQWLSEGFATFSGLWYLQHVRGSNDQYFDLLRRWKSSILLRGAEPGPIWLGYRVFATRDDDLDDYQTIIYQKGAWVVHMLRILTLDLKTMGDERFAGIMQDFYRRYEGRRASTEDFRKVVERHTDADMGWFFDQFVYGAEIPTYRVAHRSEQTADGQWKVKLRVRQENVPESFKMYVPVTLDLGKKRVARFRVKVEGPLTEIELPPVPAEPRKVTFNDLEGVLAEVKTTGWN
ncbi:MAG TPA: M1 family aminopeptidase [Gemmatimonadales bacterium]